jgi:hypothetical protein
MSENCESMMIPAMVTKRLFRFQLGSRGADEGIGLTSRLDLSSSAKIHDRCSKIRTKGVVDRGRVQAVPVGVDGVVRVFESGLG